jgi:hypothetical protein
VILLTAIFTPGYSNGPAGEQGNRGTM